MRTFFQTTHKNVCTIMGMCKSVWAYVETAKDVQLGLMPFYHIFGKLSGFHGLEIISHTVVRFDYASELPVHGGSVVCPHATRV
jgi:acyl-CoA synthetase (AMP-forming)/AMP-acid ligase II